MSERLFAVGQRVDRWCSKCAENRGQVITSVSAKGRITRISCPICGTRSSGKSGPRSTVSSGLPGDATPYDSNHTYRLRLKIVHPLYGEGEVVKLIEPQKIDVLFADRIRRLIHARGSS